MPVSSNSLFHFTDSADNLFNILQNDFVPRYSLESFASEEGTIKTGFPMVCFCDIPLSQIKNHLDIYGNYGIGLSKEWAKKNKLNPILYLQFHSKLDQYLFESMMILSVLEKNVNPKEKSPIKFLLRHIKSYEGEFKKHNKTFSNYRFYDEREWRYSPEVGELLDEEKLLNPVTLNRYNLEIKDNVLKFTPDDINYIILNNDGEIKDMIIALRRIKSPKYDNETIDKLISRILTAEQIKSDF